MPNAAEPPRADSSAATGQPAGSGPRAGTAPDADRTAPADGRPKPEAGPAPDAHGADPVPGLLTAMAALLTIGSAATDVMSFSRLGSVFASVMTSNIVLLGLAAARQSPGLAEHAAVSFAGYVAGVAAASRLARVRAPAGRGGHGGKPGKMLWSPGIAAALIAETGVFVIFTVGWEATGTKPAGGAQLLLLALATVAMGMQSAVVIAMGISGVSTTYLTGTLTTLVEALANPDRRNGHDARQVIVLLALVVGAGLSGLLLATVPSAVLAIPFAVLIGVIGLGTGLLRRHRRRSPV
jgi:uncharacterized membrane protein YoaK (UPF0700 family)